jgi:hypothetical protein
MAAVGLQRREAEDALKQTGGDVAVALAHQLGRLRLQTPMLDCLVWEYATARWVALTDLCRGLADTLCDCVCATMGAVGRVVMIAHLDMAGGHWEGAVSPNDPLCMQV